MKNLVSLGCVASLFCTLSLGAAEVNATVSAPVPVASAQVAVSTGLPPAANEVVKLTRAQVSEDVILSYVQNSSSSSSLTSDDILRLRNEGVSDRVINAMLDRHSKVMDSLPKTSAPVPVYADNSSSSAPAQPAPTVEAPLAPTSSTYVIPYPAATSAYYGYYRPYYYPYSYGYPYYGYGGYYGGPVFSFRFGFGGHGGGWRGGHGGGWHGGGHHGHR